MFIWYYFALPLAENQKKKTINDKIWILLEQIRSDLFPSYKKQIHNPILSISTKTMNQSGFSILFLILNTQYKNLYK